MCMCIWHACGMCMCVCVCVCLYHVSVCVCACWCAPVLPQVRAIYRYFEAIVADKASAYKESLQRKLPLERLLLMVPMEGTRAEKIDALHARVIADQATGGSQGKAQTKNARVSVARQGAAEAALSGGRRRSSMFGRRKSSVSPNARRSFLSGESDVYPIGLQDRQVPAYSRAQSAEVIDSSLAWLGHGAQALLGWLGLNPSDAASPAAAPADPRTSLAPSPSALAAASPDLTPEPETLAPLARRAPAARPPLETVREADPMSSALQPTPMTAATAAATGPLRHSNQTEGGAAEEDDNWFVQISHRVFGSAPGGAPPIRTGQPPAAPAIAPSYRTPYAVPTVMTAHSTAAPEQRAVEA